MEDFKVNQITRRVTLIEAMGGDVHGWGNDTETSPAFLTYVGCESLDEARAVKDLLINGYGAYEVSIRPGRRTGHKFECKAYGIQREPMWGPGLDSIVEATQFNDSLSLEFALAVA